MPTLLRIKNVSKYFPGVKALDNITMDIEKNEIHAICGENGAGKSTLISILGGIYPYGSYEGDIYLKDKKIEFKNPKDAEEAGIAVIHQELTLFEELSIIENIYMGSQKVKGLVIDWNSMYEESQILLKKLKLDDLNIFTKIKHLGVGKQQLIEIAKALVKKANILILDEPTASLTESETNNLLALLKKLKKEGVTCIYISHKLDEIFEVADRVSILRDGKLIGTKLINEVTKNDLIKMMVGREISQMFPKRKISPEKIIFEVKNFTVFEEYNPTKKVVDNVSFNLRYGEILGFSGLVGAGRTELMSSIIGFYQGKKEGEVFLNSEKVNINSPQEALELGIAYLSEDRKGAGIISNLTVRENITIAFIKKFATFFHINKESETLKALEIIKELNIKTQSPEVKISTLSGGNQQKTLIGRNLVSIPKILIMDEPTRGIDVGAKQEIYSLMNKLTKQGISIIMISSELPEIIGMADRIIVLHEGKFMGEIENYNHDTNQEDIMYLATGIRGGKGE